MAKSKEGVYKIVEVVGISKTSWEDAGRKAVEVASKSLRDLRVAEISQLDMHIVDGKTVAYRARVKLSFKYSPEDKLAETSAAPAPAPAAAPAPAPRKGRAKAAPPPPPPAPAKKATKGRRKPARG